MNASVLVWEELTSPKNNKAEKKEKEKEKKRTKRNVTPLFPLPHTMA